MKKIHYKRIIGVLILFLAFSYVNVFADDRNAEVAGDGSDKCTSFSTTDFQSRYGISFAYNKDLNPDYIRMQLNSNMIANAFKTNGKIKDEVKFKVVAVHGIRDVDLVEVDIPDFASKIRNSNLTLSSKNEIIFNTFSEEYESIKVILQPLFTDQKIKKNCGAGSSMLVWISISNFYKPSQEVLTAANLPDSVGTPGIDCNSYQSKFAAESFEYKFCDMKNRYNNAPESSKKAYTFTAERNTFSKLGVSTASFKCDPYKLVTGVPENDSEYYVNTNYLYGEGTLASIEGKYVYNYGCQAKSETVSCKIKCEEVVEVEYGAPVASKAGLCFEYKVKVTSRVNCSSDSGVPKPKDAILETPTPVCVHHGSETMRQGGPSEDFDSCIAECDGGKYSDKCSDKCYQEVYGETTTKTSTLELSYAEKLNSTDDYTVSKVANKNTTKVPNSEGKYVCKKGKIYWTGDGLSRWHQGHKWGIPPKKDYTKIENGIPIRNICSDKCSWKGGTGDVYLNLEDYKVDAVENAKTYLKLKSQCEAYAKCNTSTAEFTISVSYLEKGKSEETWINFPYSRSKDEMAYSGVNTKSTKDSTLLDADGCYNPVGSSSFSGTTTSGTEGTTSTSIDQRWYLSEWSFPGTWHNAKTGEISFKEITGKAWTKTDKKFCIPYDFPYVNEKWWLYYYAKMHGNDPSYAANSETTSYIEDGKNCTNTCNYATTYGTFTEEDVKNVKYNIKATTRKFGLFEWDIDISCFYALGGLDKVENCDKKCISISDDSDKKKEYKVRSVSLENLFPSKDGSSKSEAVPFNWSSYATNTLKDPEYTSNPSAYKTFVEEKGYSIYSNEYLDYEITLTREEIKKLRTQNKQFGTFDGELTIQNIGVYESPLLRGKDKLKDVTAPSPSVLHCNNIRNYRATQCEEY